MSPSVPHDDPTESQRRLQELTDRSEITELVSRLGLWLDEKRWDEARSILTEDATARTSGARWRASIRSRRRRAATTSYRPST
jgi:SnoaL-like domain